VSLVEAAAQAEALAEAGDERALATLRTQWDEEIEHAARDRDYRLTPAQVRRFESMHGTIASGSIVLLRTGWSIYWPHRSAYLGDDTPGRTSHLHFPSYGRAAAALRPVTARSGTVRSPG